MIHSSSLWMKPVAQDSSTGSVVIHIITHLLPLMLTLALALAAPLAQAFTVALVSEQRDGVHRELSEGLLRAANLSEFHILDAGTPEEGLDGPALRAAAMILAAGAAAADATLAQASDTPVLVVLISRSQALDLLRRHPQRHIAAVVLDQPIERQLQLIRSCLPEAERVDTLFGPQNVDRIDDFAREAEARGMHFSANLINTSGELNRALERLFTGTDAFLALPEPLLNTPTAARAILLSSFRHRRPVFAYSRAYVEAGALAAVFSSPGDVVRDTLQILEYARLGQMPSAGLHEPVFFDVAINAQVARALRIDLPDKRSLLDSLQALGQQGEGP